MLKQDSTNGVRNQQKKNALEDRMMEDMTRRGYSPMTQKIYWRAVRHLSEHYGNRTVEQISVVEAQAYTHMTEPGTSAATEQVAKMMSDL